MFVTGAVKGQSPFAVVQLLWMNLVMDILAAIALCTEPFEKERKDNCQFKRLSRKEKIFTSTIWKNIITQAIYQIIVILTLVFSGHQIFFNESIPLTSFSLMDKNYKATSLMIMNTMCFHTFMLMNIINMINCKASSEDTNVFKKFQNNKFFLLILCLELIIQFMMIYFSDNQTVSLLLGTAPITNAM